MAVDSSRIEEERKYNIDPPESVYEKGLYVLNKNKNCKKGKHIESGSRLSFDVISSVMASAQKICFEDDKIGENKARIMGILNSMVKNGDNPTIVVGLSINKDEEDELPNFNDAASLTIQKMILDRYGNRNSYWINEVCRSAVDRSKIPSYLDTDGELKYFSPVPTLMEMAIQYVRDIPAPAVYLSVEKKPDNKHMRLVSYYNKRYGFERKDEDDDYIYMEKIFDPVGGKRKTRKNTRKNRKKSRKNKKKINKKSRKNRK